MVTKSNESKVENQERAQAEKQRSCAYHLPVNQSSTYSTNYKPSNVGNDHTHRGNV